ncbi:MAG: bis(5'-nucleosyl)-tetraphosphatase (symmetrical) YqeK [Cyanobacteriota bacterium]|nr:bis(5'-nucleosyl)-tetraphosphatase (symmetrical) YqeK [Cyanobacteriota bacterium]
MTELSFRDRVLAWLAENVPPPRVRHILGVEQLAVDLARHHHLDPERARTAGLLHDLAKYYKPDRLLAMARAEGLEIDPVCELNPHLLHADVSAIVARDEFGIEDEAILHAIANHTLGNPHMSALSCVVFVADTLEPSRGQTPELEALRQTSRDNLYESVWKTSDYTLRFLLDGRRFVHPRAVLTRNWALMQSNANKTLRKKHWEEHLAEPSL